MADIFISYSHSDRPTLDILLPLMRNAVSESIWFDERIDGGEEWWQRILEEISHCRLFLYLISDDAAESEHCQNELRHALETNKAIIPVLIRRLRMEYPGNMPDDLIELLRKIQCIDLSQRIDINATSKLWGTMTRKLYAASAEAAPPSPAMSVPISLSVNPPPESSGTPVNDRQINLSRKERWFLSNQFAILAKLYPDEADGYEDMREVVERGYELHYNWITEYIFDARFTMSQDDCLEVLDILDMFSTLQSAYEEITDKSGIDDVWIHFAGFDGNNETKYMAYTRFLVEREGKFTWLITGERPHDRFNSHHPILHRYRAMSEEWKKSQDQRNLTKDDLIRITSVKVSFSR